MPGPQQLIFISHPMEKCADAGAGINDWRTCDKGHCRRFIQAQGDYVDEWGHLRRDKQLFFWGEWEARAHVELLGSPCYPGQVCTPLYSTVEKERWARAYSSGDEREKRHNTDPYVFGDRFLYANCRQEHENLSHPLAPESLILFGGLDKTGEKVLVDTVFVVRESIPYTPEELAGAYYKHGRSLIIPVGDYRIDRGFIEISTLPLFYFSHSLRKKRFTLYRGKSYQEGSGMFSFVPCRPYSSQSNSQFAPIDVTAALTTDFVSEIVQEKVAAQDSSLKKLLAIWEKICELGRQNGCRPAVRLNSPQG